jgi:hypothetical protein
MSLCFNRDCRIVPDPELQGFPMEEVGDLANMITKYGEAGEGRRVYTTKGKSYLFNWETNGIKLTFEWVRDYFCEGYNTRIFIYTPDWSMTAWTATQDGFRGDTPYSGALVQFKLMEKLDTIRAGWRYVFRFLVKGDDRVYIRDMVFLRMLIQGEKE